MKLLWYTPWTIKTVFFAGQHFFSCLLEYIAKNCSSICFSVDVKLVHRHCADAVVKLSTSVHFDNIFCPFQLLKGWNGDLLIFKIFLLSTWLCNFRKERLLPVGATFVVGLKFCIDSRLLAAVVFTCDSGTV